MQSKQSGHGEAIGGWEILSTLASPAAQPGSNVLATLFLVTSCGRPTLV